MSATDIFIALIGFPIWIGMADKVPYGIASYTIGFATGWLLCKGLNFPQLKRKSRENME